MAGATGGRGTTKTGVFDGKPNPEVDHKWPALYLLPELDLERRDRESNTDAEYNRESLKEMSQMTLPELKPYPKVVILGIAQQVFQNLSGLARALITSKVALRFYTTLNLANTVVTGIRFMTNFYFQFIRKKTTEATETSKSVNLTSFAVKLRELCSLSRELDKFLDLSDERGCRLISSTRRTFETVARKLEETYPPETHEIVKVHAKKGIYEPERKDRDEFWNKVSSDWFCLAFELRDVPFPRIWDPVRLRQIYLLDRKALNVSEFRMNLSSDIWSNLIFQPLFNSDLLGSIRCLTVQFMGRYNPEGTLDEEWTSWLPKYLHQEVNLSRSFVQKYPQHLHVELELGLPRQQRPSEIMCKMLRIKNAREAWERFLSAEEAEIVGISIQGDKLEIIGRAEKEKKRSPKRAAEEAGEDPISKQMKEDRFC